LTTMITFVIKERFSRTTGKPIESAMAPHGRICDYSGITIDLDNYDANPIQKYTVEEISGCEPQFHEDELTHDGKTIDLYDLFNTHDHFVYSPSVLGMAPERLLVMEWAVDMNPGSNKKFDEEIAKIRMELGFDTRPVFGDCMTIGNAMYAARYRVIRKLLKDGFDPKRLGLKFKEDEE
jgi:hypothetical protein